MRRIAVLTSNAGSGSNLQALIDNQADTYDGQLVCVISSSPNAYALVRAHEADIPAETWDLSEYIAEGKPRSLFEQDLARKLQTYNPDLIILAGWTLSLSHSFLRYFPWKVLNLHPGLLGDKPGEPYRLPNGQNADPCIGLSAENAIKAILASGQPYAGSTVHVVTGNPAETPVVMRGLVEVEDTDTVESLYTRLKGKEHEIIVESLRQLCLPKRTRK